MGQALPGQQRYVLIWINLRMFPGFAEMMRGSALCGSLTAYPQGETGDGAFEIAVSFNLLQQSNHPREHLCMLNRHLMTGVPLFCKNR